MDILWLKKHLLFVRIPQFFGHGPPNYPHQKYHHQKQGFNKALRDKPMANNPLISTVFSARGPRFDGGI